MPNAKFWRRIVAFVATAMTLSAQAGEIVLFEYGDFNGRSLTLRGPARNFADLGFNDRASSMVVSSGTWEVCTDANFQGTCVAFGRGEYAQLDRRLDSRISSAREVGNAGGGPGGEERGWERRRGAVELFERRDFNGASFKLDRDADNFSTFGFNDRARSMVVHEGHWELCVDTNYRGACRIYGPGRYSDLGPGMAREVSSARSAGMHIDAPYVIGGNGGPAPVYESARIVFYDQEGLRGRSLALSRNTVDFAPTGFNDQAASMQIDGGWWEICTDAYFQGQCRVLGPGQYRRLDPALQRAVSSARLTVNNSAVNNDAPRRLPLGERGDIELYEHDNFSGRRFSAHGAVDDLANQNFNDLTSSVVVYTGQWELCEHARYAGRCVVFGPGRYAGLGGFNDQISSLRRLDR